MNFKPMLNMKKSLLFFVLLFLGIINPGTSQVTSVKYLIEYNDSTSLYDCKIVIMEGEAMAYLQRIQFASLYTIVVPTGAQIQIDTLYNPKESNHSYTGTIPCLWQFGSFELSPPAQPQHDFHSVFPNLSPPSAYNDLIEGDTITLFSLIVDVDPCDNSVRPFINGVDPSSLEMPSGGDFSNGFSLGGVDQIYDGNLLVEDHKICGGECVELIPSLICSSDSLTYIWSTGETTPTITVCPNETTSYSIEITGPNSTINIGSNTVSVTEVPAISITGPDQICINGSTKLTPSTGVIWTSSNVLVSTIDNSGNVTGLSVGCAEFTYTDIVTGCTSLPSVTICVVDDPMVAFTGDDRLCIGETSTVSPNTGGTWVSNNNNYTVATIVASTGIITGVGQGAVTFTFTDSITGCSATTSGLIVDPVPSVSTNLDEMCINSTATLSPSSGGSWTALNPSIAALSGSIVTAISSGDAGFLFTSDATGCVSDTLFINVDSGTTPIIETPYTDLCLGATMAMSPSTGGTWSTSNSAVAVINSTGILTTISQGTVICTFTSSETGCSANSETITVHLEPFADIVDPMELCVGETSTIFPNPEGTWLSDNPTVISVDFNSGAISALTGGTAILSFTSTITDCSSDIEVIAHDSPVVGFSGSEEICVEDQTNLFPNSGGTWVSNNPFHATITNSGVVTGISEGNTSFTFTSSTSGCSSEPLMIIIHANPEVNITGSEIVCLGNTTSASPTTGGVWTSSNPLVASIHNNGDITPLSEGFVSFTFSDGQCTSTTNEIQVVAALTIDIDTTICEGMNYNGLEESGTYTIDSVDTVTGCDITITIDLEVLPLSDPLCTVGIEELPESEVKVYPNPTSGLVFVESESALESISIYTVEYQKVEEVILTKDTKKTQINTDKFNRGLYFLAIKSRGLLIYKKMIVE